MLWTQITPSAKVTNMQSAEEEKSQEREQLLRAAIQRLGCLSARSAERPCKRKLSRPALAGSQCRTRRPRELWPWMLCHRLSQSRALDGPPHQGGRDYHSSPYFTDEETEAKRSPSQPSSSWATRWCGRGQQATQAGCLQGLSGDRERDGGFCREIDCWVMKTWLQIHP